MLVDELRKIICQSSLSYAHAKALEVDLAYPTAIIFKDIGNAFHPASSRAICNNPKWHPRTLKCHSKAPKYKEMQSSNSSDALLMSIFCHPMLATWKGVELLLKFKPTNPEFGFEPLVRKAGTSGDTTEIDMAVGDHFIEAKLTEPDFVNDKRAADVEKYTDFSAIFDKAMLPRNGGCYQNYQVIRNLLAAIQHKKKHLLLCDERRPDLMRRYMETVCCLKEPQHRKNCRVIFWQELQRACGEDLKSYVQSRYGMA